MTEQSPYLFDPGDDTIAVASDIDGATIDLTVRGTWHEGLTTRLTAIVRKCLAPCPARIVADLDGLRDPRAESAPVWSELARTIARVSPGTRLALCLPARSALAVAVAGLPGVTVHPSAADAHRDPGGGDQPAEVLRLRLPPSPTSPSLARNLVGGACHEWQLPALLHPGRAVLSELVTNVVEHARTDMDISISRRSTGLHLAVRDNDPTLPRVRELAPIRAGQPFDDRGRGLRVVHADSTAWGAIATAGGKMVWATVRDRGGKPRNW